MSETDADLPSAENVVGRTVTVARKMQVYHTELVRTKYGSLIGNWTDTEGWAPDEEVITALRDLVRRFTDVDGPDVFNLKWERDA